MIKIIRKGYILTGLLFSIALCTQSAPTGKSIVSILGDSYSTFENYIPKGNLHYYSPSLPHDISDVDDVKLTWWWQLIAEGGYILGVNESYSGSTVSYTGYNGEDYRDRSFITRLPRVCPSDILLIFGATNDSWTDCPIGDYRYEKPTLGHLYEFRPALAKLLSDAVNRFPGSRIVFIINTELKEEITSSIIEECKYYKVEFIRLHDIDKKNGHPTAEGMRAIAEQIRSFLNPEDVE